ncbi:DUF397 domain-containing protein [Micromonospora sp. CPCC 206061]|uniref:DUF397 domain-containing protein n=1 Tax=Micromonospora sp. CPCC 206061 TaxID=3122410 RepID=UPI002FF29C5A
MSTPQINFAIWWKSSRSSGGGNCVEVAVKDCHVGVRDSKNPGAAMLVFSAPSWSRFVSAIRAGHLKP